MVRYNNIRQSCFLMIDSNIPLSFVLSTRACSLPPLAYYFWLKPLRSRDIHLHRCYLTIDGDAKGVILIILDLLSVKSGSQMNISFNILLSLYPVGKSDTDGSTCIICSRRNMGCRDYGRAVIPINIKIDRRTVGREAHLTRQSYIKIVSFVQVCST